MSSTSETQSPFGSLKRDRVLAGRAIYWLAGILAVAVQSVIIYAGNAYLETRAGEAVDARLTPVAKATAAELEKRLLTSAYASDLKLSELREADMARRVADLEATARVNRNLIEAQKENFHRLELMLREGFAKQGVQLSTPAK